MSKVIVPNLKFDSNEFELEGEIVDDVKQKCLDGSIFEYYLVKTKYGINKYIKEEIKTVQVMENINNEFKELFVQMTAQQVYDKYIRPLSDNPDYTLPETGAMLFYTKKHSEGYDIDKVTFTALNEDYCISLIESVMDSEDFAGWPFGK